MMVAVWKIGKSMPSKWNDGNNRRIVFKGLDDGKSYYLNLTDVHGVNHRWMPFLKLGNVLDVSVIPNTNNVNKFGQIYFVREGEKEQVPF